MPTSEERSPPSRLPVSFAFRLEVEAVGGIRFVSSPFAIGPLHLGLNVGFEDRYPAAQYPRSNRPAKPWMVAAP
jgi:hypothetical protein